MRKQYHQLSVELKGQQEKKVELSTQTNKELLGGLKLRVGNTIFDGTIANQMAKMKKVLLQKY